MAKPKDFTPEQALIIRATARKIFNRDFAWMKAVKKTKTTPYRPGGQEAMGLALGGVTQQTVSALLDPKSAYSPGFRIATAVANLDGKTLDELIGDYAHEDAPESAAEEEKPPRRPTPLLPAHEPFANLTTCINYNSAIKQWSPWTIAAARAGYFGNTDFSAPEWGSKLDHLEKALERARKSS